MSGIKKPQLRNHYYSFSISLAILMAEVIKPVGIARKPKPIIKTKMFISNPKQMIISNQMITF